MCQRDNAAAKLLLLVIMAATFAFLMSTLPPANTVEAAVWVR